MRVARFIPALILAALTLLMLPQENVLAQGEDDKDSTFSIFLPVISESIDITEFAENVFSDSMPQEQIESTMNNLTNSELEKLYAILDEKAEIEESSESEISAAYWPGDASHQGYWAERVELHYGFYGSAPVVSPSYYFYSRTWCDGDSDWEIVVKFDVGTTNLDVTRFRARNTDPEINGHLIRAYGSLNSWRRVLPGAVNDRYIYMCIGDGGYKPFGGHRTAMNMRLKLW